VGEEQPSWWLWVPGRGKWRASESVEDMGRKKKACLTRLFVDVGLFIWTNKA